MAETVEYHVLTKYGDASAEIEDVLRELGTVEASGLHRYFFVSRANQTVVMTGGPSAPLAERLRMRHGWREPGGRDNDVE